MIGSAIAGPDYTYDVRGNILKVADLASLGTLQWEYNYDGDILTQAEQSRRIGSITYNFAHDSLGRMTFDGLNGLNIEYNILNLPKKIGNSDSTLVNYSYLADGTKISSLTQLGEGLVFRGPFHRQGRPETGLRHTLQRPRSKALRPFPPTLDDSGPTQRKVLRHQPLCLLR